jgi:hypothetical protein
MASVDSFGGAAGVAGSADFAGVGGSSVAGSGGQATCPPDALGRTPGCADGLIDADWDGYGDPTVPHACCGPDGPLPLITDCDDTDPTLSIGAFADADGDGRGTGEPVCGPDPLPAGFSVHSGDCNDADRQVDWQGSSDCPCERFEFEPVVPANPDCATAPDLFVVDYQACTLNCGQWLAFRVGNAGGVAAEGPITVSMKVRSEEATLTLETLGPGEASGWRKVPLVGFTGPATISISSPTGGCPESRPSFETELVNSCSP